VQYFFVYLIYFSTNWVEWGQSPAGAENDAGGGAELPESPPNFTLITAFSIAGAWLPSYKWSTVISQRSATVQ